jgi:hypothetical protein
MIEGSGSLSLTIGSGCGTGRPKNIWILRIRIRATLVENVTKFSYFFLRRLPAVKEAAVAVPAVVSAAVTTGVKVTVFNSL